jgi:hypothetical protein
MKKLFPSIGALAAGFALTGGSAVEVDASSHREAPAIAEDQYADNTDVYSFISPNNPNNLVVIADYVPLLLGPAGPNFYRFSDEAFYEVHFDNDGDAKDDITYRWTFKNKIKNGSTFLYNTGPVDSITSLNLNVTQTYRLEKIVHKTGKKTRIMDEGHPDLPAREDRPQDRQEDPDHGRRAGRAVERRQAVVPELRAGRAPGRQDRGHHDRVRRSP